MLRLLMLLLLLRYLLQVLHIRPQCSQLLRKEQVQLGRFTLILCLSQSLRHNERIVKSLGS